jgi:mannosyltransferase OCH1-like enzyme
MKTYVKVLGIIGIILAGLILLKFVHIITGIFFFVIGMGLLVYYGFIKKNNRSFKKNPKILKEIPILDKSIQISNTNNTILLLQSKSNLNIEVNNESYAKIHNIDYISFIPNESIWSYINDIIKKKKYTYIVYMGSNMNIIDHTKDIRRIIQQGGDNEMILCRDEKNTNTVNLDVIIFRDSKWTLYKLKQLYYADVNKNLSYDIIMDQVYTTYLPKYHISDNIVDKGLPYLLLNICVYNEHAFNSSCSSFIVNTSIHSSKIDIYPWKGVDGYMEIDKNLNNLPHNPVHTERKIPRYIFQTMETSLIPLEIYTNCQQQWILSNPNYSYFFFDSLDRKNFIKDNFPSYVFKMYNKLIPGAYKADLWRYCVLYKYGGCYIDVMISPLKSLDSIIKDDDTFVASHPLYKCSNCIDQGFLSSKPKNDIIFQAIKHSCININFNNYSTSSLAITGPILLSRVINNIYNKDLNSHILVKNYPNIKLLLHDHKLGVMSYNNEQFMKTKLGNKWQLTHIPGWLQHYTKMYKDKDVFKQSTDYKFDWSNIDGVLYINLDHRLDRKKHIEAELDKMGVPRDKITRVSATKHNLGYIGCAHSHMKACQIALDNYWNNVLIFEDDFEFISDRPLIYKMLNALFTYVDEWDGVVLSSSLINKKECIYSVFMDKNLGSLTASGYLINRKMMTVLRDTNQSSYMNLIKGKDKEKFACDVLWQKIQNNNKWYAFSPKLGKQIVSYSDIEKKVVDYKNLES